MSRLEDKKTNKIYTIFFITCFYCLCGINSWAEEWYSVRWVNDGDTIVLSDGRRIRYLGINTPEVEHENKQAEPYGNEAREYNSLLVSQKKVRLEFDKEKNDHYGRSLAYVFLKDGTFVNAKMIEQGYASCLYIRPNIKYAEALLQLQQNAMSGRLGIWKDTNRSGPGYTGNMRSKKFHHLSCPYGKKIDKKNSLLLQSKWDAFWAGFALCRKCSEFIHNN